MLEIRHVSKIYKTKKQAVKALDDISLTIQDKGMVFILGKSGSGKSTLLNVLGGLDAYDEGEILIQSKSSKQFKQADFDSYRNTFIGFIFQEYNVMENFTVKENIVLALQLQGKKVDEQSLQHILQQVDLVGLENRKPNELSGGQLQRVAIARALIKDPQIIMADEPSGALDSNTGKQVFDTLKKLSKEKLVIVVSHDKEFAQQYADRIIELADGKIISDVTKKIKETTSTKHMQIVDDIGIYVPDVKTLCEEDIQTICNAMKQQSSEMMIVFKEELIQGMKQRLHIAADGVGIFQNTTQEEIKSKKKQRLSFIKARLPFKSSMKLACSNLKVKPIRLCITIMLSIVAFTLFGITSTFASYQKEVATWQSMINQNVNYIALNKTLYLKNGLSSMDLESKLTDEDIKQLQTKFPNIAFAKTFSQTNYQTSLDFTSHIANSEVHETDVQAYKYPIYFTGLSEMSASTLKENQFDLIGDLPTKDDEIVIPKVVADTFVQFGYQYEDRNGNMKTFTIEQAKDMIGKTMRLMVNGHIEIFHVSGIVDTKLDFTRYEVLSKQTDQLKAYYLQRELSYLLYSSYHTLAYVSPSYLQNIISDYDIYVLKGQEIAVEQAEIYHYYQYVQPQDKVEKQRLVKFQEGDVYVNYYAIKEYILSNGMTLQQYVEQGIDTHNDTSLQVMKTRLEQVKNEIINHSQLNRYSYIDDMETLELAGIYIPANETMDNVAIVTKQGEQKVMMEKDGYMDYVVAPMCDEQTLKELISYTYAQDTKQFHLINQVMPMLETVNEVVFTLKDVAFWIGVGFAIFAAAMFSNFIATSITNKKREIGILRAVGARGVDILKIFLNESFIIAFFNAILTIIVCIIAVQFINHFISDSFSVIVTIFHFGILQIIYIICISIVVALIASALPVYKISRKKPIDAIKNRK